MNRARIAYTIVGLIILALLAYYAVTVTRPAVKMPSAFPVVVQISDPPTVPNGTQSLLIGYSSVGVLFSNSTGSAKWIYSKVNGTIDLLGLVNLTKTIANFTLPSNSLVETLLFNVTKAEITINNNTYPVTLPNSSIFVHVFGNRIDQASSLVADFNPTVVTIITNNSTPIFVMVPSVKAVIVPGINKTASKIGSVSKVNATLAKHFVALAPSISIVDASLETSGNNTSIEITVRNSGNQSVILRNILIFGNESMQFSWNFSNFSDLHPQPQMPNIPFSTSINSSAIVSNLSKYVGNATGIFNSVKSNLSRIVGNSLAFNSINVSPIFVMKHIGKFSLNTSSIEDIADEISKMHGQINVSEMESMIENITHNSSLAHAFEHINQSMIDRFLNRTEIGEVIEREHAHFRVINFLISRNGTLELPFSEESAMSAYTGGGYVLKSNSTATLKFEGVMALGDGHVVLGFEKGEFYRIVVTGERGARAFTNVTAS